MNAQGNSPPAGATGPSIFTRIIRGEIPGRFVWRDDLVVAILTIAPIRPGHTMVVPIEEVDHWLDVPATTWARVGEVSQAIGSAQMEAFKPARIGSMILGMEVPHCHVHLVPIDNERDLSFANADATVSDEAQDASAEAIRAALRAAGHTACVPDSNGEGPTGRAS
ncbi:MAG: HIT family protein [Microthrixaceae bacterium]|nr:HIT family protein [Microthrixaceae bacterium]MCB1011466.1 HIT family protein [Microthrixaceae bacterium]MCB9386591.1 HIT family protein [Microthrixaceae bacterium]MCO5320040.1 HIT family protein [Microthrixaceae bacterium]